MPSEEENKSSDVEKAGGEGQQLTQLQEQLGTLKGEMQSLKDAKIDLEHKLDDADKELLSSDYLTFKEGGKSSSGVGDGGQGGAGAGEGGFDYDRASNKELADHISKSASGAVNKAVVELANRMDDTEKRMGLTFAKIDVSLTSNKHSDFEENREAIYKVAKDNPSWGAEKCYRQFKLESKQTADEKATADEKKAEEERSLATEKGGVSDSIAQGKKLTADEAAELAYRKAFGNKE